MASLDGAGLGSPTEPTGGLPDKATRSPRAESAIGRIKSNPAKPRPLESILPSIIETRGFDRFVCYCARRRVEINAAHAGAGDLDDVQTEAFSRREIGSEDDVLDFFVGHFVDIDLTRQPSS
jgi:hypothetical protein